MPPESIDFDMWADVSKKIDDSKDLDELIDIFKFFFTHSTQPSRIYHYTSPDGFLGIIKDDFNFRFTRADCLNDLLEGKQFLEVYETVCNEMVSENADFKQPNEEFFSKIKMPNEFLVDTDHGLDFVNIDTYIGSFSLEPDCLPMWNYYLNNNRYEGYCLGICTDSLPLHSLQIIYDDEKKKNMIRSVIKKICEFANHEGNLTKFLGFMRNFLFNCCYIFKPSYFKHEREIRLIYHNNSISKTPIDFRIKNGMLMPFIKVKINKNNLTSVKIAPLVKEEIAKHTTLELLKNYDYENVEVTNSIIDIRY